MKNVTDQCRYFDERNQRIVIHNEQLHVGRVEDVGRQLALYRVVDQKIVVLVDHAVQSASSNSHRKMIQMVDQMIENLQPIKRNETHSYI